MRPAVIWGAGILVSAGLLSVVPLSSASMQGPILRGTVVQGEGSSVISAGDGYGIGECLTSGDACGSLVALSWCQANGYSRLVAYRKADAEDVTGTVGTLLTDDNGGSVVINCGS
jgi:hypothetical protein